MPVNPFPPDPWSRACAQGDASLAVNDPALWRDLFPVPKVTDNKYSRGHALIAGGAVMTGAARLSARAAQRMGAGLVTLAASPAALPIYAEALESVIVRPVETAAQWSELAHQPKADVLLIGPGLGLGSAQAELVLATLDAQKPTVLDADALTNFASDPKALFAALHPSCVLTPHEGEFDRLFAASLGATASRAVDKLARARAAAALAGCVVLLKGAETVIAAPDGVAVVNANAPPWLATAGAGDVLAGMILGLLAQKMPVLPAAAAAAWLHGSVAAAFGLGLIAEDLVAGIPAALQGLGLQP